MEPVKVKKDRNIVDLKTAMDKKLQEIKAIQSSIYFEAYNVLTERFKDSGIKVTSQNLPYFMHGGDPRRIYICLEVQEQSQLLGASQE